MDNCIEKIKSVNRRCRKNFHKYINGTKGVISIFLALLMVPFTTIAGYLISAARINSAVAIFDEALCNASNSTLGTYDSFLRKRFGLLAMSQDTSSRGSGYTVEDLLSETFDFYMEESLGALSNTYLSYDISAAGVYPLADTDVLLSQVLEAGKYTVPTKLVIDGFSIDDLLNQFTEPLNMAKNIFENITSGTNMVDKLTDCENKLNALPDKIKKSEAAKEEYDAAYNEFVSAVDEYNDLVDEYIEKLNEKKSAVNSAQKKVDNCKSKYDSEKDNVADILKAIEDMENEKDAEENSIDNSEKIKAYKEEHKDEIASYNNASDELDSANSELSAANTALQNLIDSYAKSFEEKRAAVKEKKEIYVSKIDAFASALKDTGEAVSDAQSGVTDLFEAGVSFTGSFVNTVYEYQKESVSNQISEMEGNRDAAKTRGDNVAEYLWEDQIKEAETKRTEIDNEKTIIKAANETQSTAVSSLQSFKSEKYSEQYQDAYSRLTNLIASVKLYEISSDNASKLVSAKSYYEEIDTILSSGDVQGLMEGLADELAQSSFIAVVKAIAGFIKAIYSLTIWYDPELCASIDINNYDSIGGLPSYKDRSDGSQYSLKSQYSDMDKKKSDYYKSLLGAYSNNPNVEGGMSAEVNALVCILQSMNTILDVCDNLKWSNVFSSIGKLASAIMDITKSMLVFLNDAVNYFLTMIMQRALLTGYIAYNIPNRTTYTDSALTGASFSLPNLQSSKQGYAFYGAETEYIIHGSLSEIENQESLFHSIYFLRFIYDIFVVATNTEVATIAGEAGAATFGIGTVVVYVLYFIAEPFVDTLILVNSGDVPMVKLKAYLTPSGIVDLIEVFYNLKLTDDKKNEAYKEIVKVASIGQASDQFAQNYADAVSSGIKDPNKKKPNKFVDALTFDYTKTLFLVMMMFGNTDAILSRLADVIQMESSFNAVSKIDSYTFNLDKSYTYLRASGIFETNEFLKVSDGAVLKSKERVIYRGY